MKNLLITLIVFIVSFTSVAKEGWEFSLGTGSAWSYGEGVIIKMDNAEDINLGTVDFETKPFDTPFYYNVRIGHWEDNKAWEGEFIHHKLYAKSSSLSNGVSQIEVTHGYNLLYVNYAVKTDNELIYRMGLGVVIPHPDVIVNDVRSQGDYQLGGFSSQLSVEKEFNITESVLFSIEGKMTYSYAKIDLDYGKFTLPNTALHLVANLKFN